MARYNPISFSPEDVSQIFPFLAGKKLNVAGFEEETAQDLTDWITEAAGEVVYSDFTGVLDYLIVPVFWSGEAKQQHHQLVNKHWIDDCLDAGELLGVCYQHIPLAGEREAGLPLAGVVTCLSGYITRERQYLNSLVEYLGGVAQVVA